MLSLNSIFGSSFNDSLDFQGFSSRAMENHNCHSHSRSRESLHMKGQAETASGKKEGDLKDDRPGNIQDRHQYPCLPHLHVVPREAERPPASQAKVLDSHNNRIPLQAGICFAEGIARMPGLTPMAAIIPPISTVSNLPVMVFWTEG